MKRRYSIFYFFAQAVKNLVRNKVMSLASISVLMSCLVVIGGFGLLVVNANEILNGIGLDNEIVVFVEYDLPENRVKEVEEEIRALENVDAVTFVSKEEGLEQMADKYSDDVSYVFEVLREENPFADSFRVNYTDNGSVATLEWNLQHIEGVKDVKNMVDTAMKIENLKNGITFVFFWFLIILVVVSVFIIINTINLSVFSRRNEISVMRYIGATKAFVVTPFVIEGVIIGMLSGGLAFLVEWYIYSYIYNTVQTDVQFITLIDFASVDMSVLAGFLILGVVTGIIGSSISLRKHMKA